MVVSWERGSGGATGGEGKLGGLAAADVVASGREGLRWRSCGWMGAEKGGGERGQWAVSQLLGPARWQALGGAGTGAAAAAARSAGLAPDWAAYRESVGRTSAACWALSPPPLRALYI